MSPFDVLKGKTVQLAGTSTDHPTEPWYSSAARMVTLGCTET
jgi:hypothetical protein